MTVERFETANSVYEIDQDEKRIRRVSGVNQPTSNQGADGEWKAYQKVMPFGTRGNLYIEFSPGQATVTSPVTTDLDLRCT